MMSSTFGAPLGGTTRGGHQGLESLALSLITPPNFGGGGGSCFPSIVIVALGEPGVPVICCAAAGATASTAAITNVGDFHDDANPRFPTHRLCSFATCNVDQPPRPLRVIVSGMARNCEPDPSVGTRRGSQCRLRRRQTGTGVRNRSRYAGFTDSALQICGKARISVRHIPLVQRAKPRKGAR